jgi:hypothetical protein
MTTPTKPPGTLDDETIRSLDPGIRGLVLLINRLGWETTDSGDGKTKFDQEEAMACAVGYAHVIATAHGPACADMLHAQLVRRLTLEGCERLDVQYSYSTKQQFKILEVTGINDEDLVP